MWAQFKLTRATIVAGTWCVRSARICINILVFTQHTKSLLYNKQNFAQASI